MVPLSKLDRFVLTDQAVRAGLPLIVEAQRHAADEVARAIGIRNGLMLVLISLYLFRAKNFAALAIGETLRQIKTDWWITLPRGTTKTRRADERRVHDWLIPYLDLYLTEARPVLLRVGGLNTNALWLSSSGRPITPREVGRLISRISFRALGISSSRPHVPDRWRNHRCYLCARLAPSQQRIARPHRAVRDGTELHPSKQHLSGK
jgi:hypothetical protein